MLVPPLTGVGAVLIYIFSFYQVKFNQYGLSEKATTLSSFLSRQPRKWPPFDGRIPDVGFFEKIGRSADELFPRPSSKWGHRHPTLPVESTNNQEASVPQSNTQNGPATFGATVKSTAKAGAPHRRVVLIATMEYDIEDWDIKIKIGGLGVVRRSF